MDRPFSLDADRFDQSTFWGRICHFYHMIDPRMLLVPHPSRMLLLPPDTVGDFNRTIRGSLHPPYLPLLPNDTQLANTNLLTEFNTQCRAHNHLELS